MTDDILNENGKPIQKEPVDLKQAEMFRINFPKFDAVFFDEGHPHDDNVFNVARDEEAIYLYADTNNVSNEELLLFVLRYITQAFFDNYNDITATDYIHFSHMCGGAFSFYGLEPEGTYDYFCEKLAQVNY